MTPSLIRSCHLLHYPHSVGVLSGGIHSTPTVNFLKRLNEEVLAATLSTTLPPLEASSSSSSTGASFHIPLVFSSDPNSSQNLGALIQQREFLENAGAKCIVLPCPSSFKWFQCLESSSSVKLLNVVDCLMDELDRADLAPLQGAAKPRIGVLSSQGTDCYYAAKLHEQGFEVVLPDKESEDRLLVPAMEALERRDFQGHRNLIRVAIHMLLVGAVNRVVGDNIAAALRTDDPLLLHCIDPARSLAKATVDWAKQQLQIEQQRRRR